MTLTIQLGLLESAGLIRLASIQPELEYLFRHVLVKDAAYHSLVKGDRRALHRAVGETLENVYARSDPDHIPSQLYPLLGLHFAEAGDAHRALRYFSLAGRAAAAVYANMEAAAHFTQALAAAGPAGASAADWIDLHTRLGRVYELAGNYPAALATYAKLEALGAQRDDQSMVLAAITPQAVVRAVPSAAVDPVQADQLTTRALALARELGDRATEARALWARMLYALLIGHMPEAIQNGEAALALARELGLRELCALTLTDIGRAYQGAGQIQQSLSALDEARQLWRALGNPHLLAESLNDAAATHYYVGNYDPALALLDEAYAVSAPVSNAWGQAYSLMLKSFILLELGSFQTAMEAMEACLRLATEGGFVAPSVQTRGALGLLFAALGQFEQAYLNTQAARQTLAGQITPVQTSLMAIDAFVHLSAGDLEGAQDLLAQARAQPSDTDGTPIAPLFLALTDAGLSLARGDYRRAVAAPSAVLRTQREAGLYSFRTDLQLAQARGLIELGQLDEAGALLDEALNLAETRHIQRLQWELLAAQADVAARRGAASLASQLRQEAQAALENLAAQLVDPALRASLIGQPRTQALLAGSPVRQENAS